MHDASFARQLRQHRLSRGLTQEQLAERARLSARAVSDLELGELQRLLQAKPLITLVGPGGVGKTRLALEVATRFAPSAAGGVRLVELASLSEAELLAERLAAALGIVERTEGSLLTTLLHSLRHAHLLLVFDNCEHVVEACAKLTE
ncbi:MAG: AAA family ATPase, partial [Chloroflexota bacterium]